VWCSAGEDLLPQEKAQLRPKMDLRSLAKMESASRVLLYGYGVLLVCRRKLII